VAGNHTGNSYHRYVPRDVAEWHAPARDWREVDGTLVFVDISGFTTLSERLAAHGRIGAEELTDVLDRVFGSMLDVAYARGGALLKFGGDALLLLFTGDEHATRACAAAVEMRRELRRAAGTPTSVGRLRLRMSTGVHSGSIHLFRAGRSHTELLVAGPAATATTAMEKAAAAGEIVVSAATRALLPAGSVSRAAGCGWLLRWRTARGPAGGVVERAETDGARLQAFVPVALRAHLGDGRTEPEHRIASVGFLRFGGVDALMAARGPAAVAGALDDVVTAVQRAVDAEGVTFLASDIDADGGKLIVAAGVPSTREDDEGRMLRALRRIADTPTGLPIRMGVHRGHVFVGEVGTEYRCAYTVMGDTVNVAARLMAAAQPGEVLATPRLLESSHTLFTTRALEPLHLKGRAEPVQAYAVGDEAGDRWVDDRRGLPFTGRARDLTVLRTALGRAVGGEGARVVVLGERGIGKTRLVQEALDTLPGMATVHVHAEPYATATPYRALRDPLRRVLGIDGGDDHTRPARLAGAVETLRPDLLPYLPLVGDVVHVDSPATREVDEIDPRFRRDRRADVIESLLSRALPGPTALVVDDAHWLDEASTHLLDRLGAAGDRAWAVVAMRRDEPGGFTPDDARRIALEPLGVTETDSLVLAATEAAPVRPHEADAIARRSGGNPRFLEEIVRALRATGTVEAVPESLDAVVGAQVDELTPHARQVLRFASVIGRRIPRRVLRLILDSEGVRLDPATRRELADFLAPDGREHLRFRHDMVREVAYEGLSYRRRRELHARTGAVIEQMHATDTDAVADLLSLHYARAQQHDRAWRYARIAGDRAMRAHGNVEAATHYERALAAARRLPDVDPGQLAAMWTLLGDVREQAGVFDGALDAYRNASRLASDPVAEAAMLLKRARARERAGAFTLALRELTVGRRRLDGIATVDGRRTRARLLALGASVRQAQARHRAALALAVDAAAEARRVGDDEALARALGVMDWANMMLGRPDRADHASEALELYERLGDLDGQASLMTTLGAKAYYDGRWAEAVGWYTRSREALLRAGNTWQAAGMGINIGEVLVNQGRLDEAEPLLRDALRVLRAAGFPDGASFAEMQLGRVLTARGAHVEAERLLEGARAAFAELGIGATALEAATHLAECRTRRGDAAGALALLDDALAAAGGDASVHAPAVARIRASALRTLGRVDEAARRAREGLDAARAQGLPYEEALILRALVDISLAAGGEPDVIDLRRSDEILIGLAVAEPA
jgi:class 3 adenylate cyclase/tetratricopeptide (TPR) repeat protein